MRESAGRGLSTLERKQATEGRRGDLSLRAVLDRLTGLIRAR
ncbi:hypothetical protein OIE68_07990 [Nocardia vinacea]|uniref:Uncharacterized protein n=1 Tax=Nocardia vinacea TaxID=96468 RepID=A0ABZ1YR62_9NOCA|nr:hypothetical protein OIE68_07990 [Nocardia vinacea]